MPITYQATKEELKEGKRRCWKTGCKGTAWFDDGTGWHWCIRHTVWLWKCGEITINSVRLRWPY